MNAYKGKGARTFKARVYDSSGKAHVRSCGTRSKPEARRMQSFLDNLRAQRRWAVLDRIIARQLTISQTFDLDGAGNLSTRMADLERADEVAREPDLSLLIDDWKKVARSQTYVRQVRRMIPKLTPFPLSQFTRGRVTTFLDSLSSGDNELEGSTINRYRAAIRVFGRWLVAKGLLEVNPVREVPGYGENDPRTVHYDEATSRKVIDALDHPYRALEALMCGSGAEWSVIEQLRARDIDLANRTVFARGGKNRWRKRTLEVEHDWCWKIFADYASGFVGEAFLFEGISDSMALKNHKRVVKLKGFEDSTLHDWRHTFAVRELKAGKLPQWVKRQLGHSPHSTTLESVYGAFIPAPKANLGNSATNPATSATTNIKLEA